MRNVRPAVCAALPLLSQYAHLLCTKLLELLELLELVCSSTSRPMAEEGSKEENEKIACGLRQATLVFFHPFPQTGLLFLF